MGVFLVQTNAAFSIAANVESHPYLETMLACVCSCKEEKEAFEFKELSINSTPLLGPELPYFPNHSHFS